MTLSFTVLILTSQTYIYLLAAVLSVVGIRNKRNFFPLLNLIVEFKFRLFRVCHTCCTLVAHFVDSDTILFYFILDSNFWGFGVLGPSSELKTYLLDL